MKMIKVQMKRTALLMMAGMLAMAGCAPKQEAGSAAQEQATALKIGVTQIVDHPSLNASRDGFAERLQELGIEVELDYQQAGGDVPTAQMIAEKMVSDQVDMIFAISTPSAQSAQNAVKDSGIPIVFTAVTDAIGAGLVGADGTSEQMTGILDTTSDDNIKQLLEAAMALKNDKQTVSVIYNTGETNSLVQVDQLKRVAAPLGLSVETIGIAALTDIDQALEVAAQKSDSTLLISDNLLASAMDLVAQKANERGLITVTPIAAYVEQSGALLSLGIDYKQLGRDTADIAKAILIDKTPIQEIAVSESTVLYPYVNQATLAKLGLTVEQLPEAFADATVVG